MPAFLEEYDRQCGLKIDGSTRLDALRFVIIDTETTGTDLAKAQLLSFGAIAAADNALDVEDSLEIVFQQKHPSVEKSAEIHGILKSHVKGATVIESALRSVIEFIQASVLVGHHVDFDRQMLEKTLQEVFPGSKLRNKVIDTAALALRLEHFNDGYVYKHGDYTLDAMCRRYNIPLTDRHTAAGDALITGQLFLKLLAKSKARQIRSLKALMKKNRPY